MRRWAFNIAVVVSLLLLAADLGLVVRGWFYADQYTRLKTRLDPVKMYGNQWILHTSSHDVLFFHEETEARMDPNYQIPNGVQQDFGSLEHKRIAPWRDDVTPFRYRFLPSRPHNWVLLEWASRSYVLGPGWGREKLVVVPQLAIVGALAILPLAMVVKRRRMHALRRIGCCGQCGYNLTGNVSGVCPECGTAILGGKTA
jgi:hypothetical protein